MPRTREQQQQLNADLRYLSLARVRAWAENGVPIEGQWEGRWIAGKSGPNSASAAIRPCLLATCTECGTEGVGAYTEEMEEDETLSASLAARAVEKAAVEHMKRRCTHCERVLAEEPPAFETLASMLALQDPKSEG